MSNSITDTIYDLPAAWDISGWLGFIRYVNAQDLREGVRSARRWHIANDTELSVFRDQDRQLTMFGVARSFARAFWLGTPSTNVRYLRGRLTHEGIQ